MYYSILIITNETLYLCICCNIDYDVNCLLAKQLKGYRCILLPKLPMCTSEQCHDDCRVYLKLARSTGHGTRAVTGRSRHTCRDHFDKIDSEDIFCVQNGRCGVLN